MRLALYQPEIPQNTGTLIRLGACLGVGIDIIEPCSFIFDNAHLRRAGMDYIEQAHIRRHQGWQEFHQFYSGQQIILLDTKATVEYWDFSFRPSDVLLVGRESDGVPDTVLTETVHQVKIPVQVECRSLNVAMAAAMVIGEARRQLRNLSYDQRSAKTVFD